MRRLRPAALNLNERERTLIKIGLEFVLGHQSTATANPKQKDIRTAQDYSPVMAKMLRRLRTKLVSSNNRKFRLDAIEAAAAQFALRIVVKKDLWKQTRTNAGKLRKREPEQVISSLSNKLENYRRRRQRKESKPSTQAAYRKRQAKWRAFLKWFRGALKPQKKTSEKKDNSLENVSRGTTAAGPIKTDPLMQMLCKMLHENAKVYESELRNVVGRVKQALRRSPERHKLTLQEAGEDPQKAINVLRCFIRESPALHKHLRMEYEDLSVQQSTLAEKFRRATIRDYDSDSGCLVPSTSLPTAPELNTAPPPPPRPLDLPKHRVDAVSLKSAADKASSVTATPSDSERGIPETVTSPERPGEKAAEKAAEKGHSAITGNGSGKRDTTSHQTGVTPGAPSPPVSCKPPSDEEVAFGIASWLIGTKTEPSSWDELMTRARSLLFRNPDLISAQYVKSTEEVTFDYVIEGCRPGEPWQAGTDQTSYLATWITSAVGKVRGTQNEVRTLLKAGLEQAIERFYQRGQRMVRNH